MCGKGSADAHTDGSAQALSLVCVCFFFLTENDVWNFSRQLLWFFFYCFCCVAEDTERPFLGVPYGVLPKFEASKERVNPYGTIRTVCQKCLEKETMILFVDEDMRSGACKVEPKPPIISKEYL